MINQNVLMNVIGIFFATGDSCLKKVLPSWLSFEFTADFFKDLFII